MRLREDLGPLRRRLAGLGVAVLAVLAGLGLRFAQLQVVEGRRWQRLAENNRLRRIPVPPRRGRIFDRRGELLAEDVPSWQLLVYVREARDLERTLLFLRRIGLGPLAALRRRLEAPGPPDAPRVVAARIGWRQLAAIRAHQADHPELVVVEGFRRRYPAGRLAAHAVGYVRLPSREDLERRPDRSPTVPVGAAGLEAREDGWLSGRPGERLVVVDARGAHLAEVGRTPAVPGRDVTTTLDLRLQRVAARALGDEAGAVVALDPADGAVRVLYASPSYDPNRFVEGLSPEAWRELVRDPGHPLQDRALRGQYPPGSTVKPFVALTALAEGAVTPAERILCRGSIRVADHRFRCWARGGHGAVDLPRSLEVSCDVYYYTLGLRLGIDRLAAGLRRFGFGAVTGLDPARERPGLVGDPGWMRRVRGEPWYPGVTATVAIGQGPLLVTPLQLARAFAALANGGSLVRPYLVAARRSPPHPLGLDPDALAWVVRGLRRVVAGREGTARRLADLPAAGKTGTAQVVRLREGVDMRRVEKSLRHHAWFVAWAPVERPRLVVAAVVEHGGSGAEAAAPVVAAVLRAALAGEGGRDAAGGGVS